MQIFKYIFNDYFLTINAAFIRTQEWSKPDVAACNNHFSVITAVSLSKTVKILN